MPLPVSGPTSSRMSHAPVRTVMVYLTDACNLRCGYCFVRKGSRRMSPQTAERLVEFLFRRDLAPSEETVQVNFFGGEPFLELERMEQIVRGATRYRPNAGRNFTFSATTNGTLCGPAELSLVRESRMKLMVSLDGGPELTAQDRPFPDGTSPHEIVIRNLGLFLEASPEVTIRATFTPRSHDLVARVKTLLGTGARSLVLSPVLEPTWEGQAEALGTAYQALAEWYLENAGPERVPPLAITNGILHLWHSYQMGGARPVRSCPAGHSLLGIDPDGHVMPCHNFLEQSPEHFGTLEDPGLFSERRRPFVEFDSSRLAGCSSCEAAPTCCGGCRAMALRKKVGMEGTYGSHCLTMRAHHRAAVYLYDSLAERGWLGAMLRQRSAGAASLANPIFR